jgi:toxin ParE1/3/4
MVERITAKSKLLRESPLMGASVPEYRDNQIREVLAYPYRLIYRAREDRVEILAAVHGARQLPEKL